MCDKCGCSSHKADNTFEQQVTEVIELIRPALQNHGGDIELVSVDADNNVNVRLQGACQGCPGAKMTMQMGVERILREKVPNVNQVNSVD